MAWCCPCFGDCGQDFGAHYTLILELVVRDSRDSNEILLHYTSIRSRTIRSRTIRPRGVGYRAEV